MHAGDDYAVDIDEACITRGEPAVIRAVVARAFAEGEQERRDLSLHLHHAVIGRPRMQLVEARGAHRAQETLGLTVQRDDRREIRAPRVADHRAMRCSNTARTTASSSPVPPPGRPMSVRKVAVWNIQLCTLVPRSPSGLRGPRFGP